MVRLEHGGPVLVGGLVERLVDDVGIDSPGLCHLGEERDGFLLVGIGVFFMPVDDHVHAQIDGVLHDLIHLCLGDGRSVKVVGRGSGRDAHGGTDE